MNSVKRILSHSVTRALVSRVCKNEFQQLKNFQNNMGSTRSISVARRLEIQKSFFDMQKRTVFIQTAATPNPESMKYIPSGRAVLEETDGNGFYVTHTESAEIRRSPLCIELFKIEGVKGIYLGADFITITKFGHAKWKFVQVS